MYCKIKSEMRIALLYYVNWVCKIKNVIFEELQVEKNTKWECLTLKSLIPSYRFLQSPLPNELYLLKESGMYAIQIEC